MKFRKCWQQGQQNAHKAAAGVRNHEFLKVGCVSFAAGVLRKRKALRAQYAVQKGKDAVNTSVLGMFAKSIDACDNLFCSTSLCSMLYMDACDNKSCSTSLRGMLYKEQKCCKYQCFGHDRHRQ